MSGIIFALFIMIVGNCDHTFLVISAILSLLLGIVSLANSIILAYNTYRSDIKIRKKNPEGIKVKVSMEKAHNNPDKKIVIKILDTGAGIPQGMDIFEPFVTENTSRVSDGGTGLGLAITKRII